MKKKNNFLSARNFPYHNNLREEAELLTKKKGYEVTIKSILIEMCADRYHNNPKGYENNSKGTNNQ